MTDLAIAVADGVALLTLNRPQRRNAYTAQMGELLNRAYRDCDNDDGVRAIVLTGAGAAFCAGADFGDFSKATNPFDAPRESVCAVVHPRNGDELARDIAGLQRFRVQDGFVVIQIKVADSDPGRR
jgi:enoyl-CoA hydratase/carnithine racemase